HKPLSARCQASGSNPSVSSVRSMARKLIACGACRNAITAMELPMISGAPLNGTRKKPRPATSTRMMSARHTTQADEANWATWLIWRTIRATGHRDRRPAHAGAVFRELHGGKDVRAERPRRILEGDRHIEQRHVVMAHEQLAGFAADEDRHVSGSARRCC